MRNFTSETAKTAKNVFNRISLLLAHLLLLYLHYDFYEQKDKKLVVVSQSAGKLIVFNNTFIPKPVALIYNF